jgi:predicted enzyme related to lactoylglutathione lyase
MSERDGYEHGVPCWVDTLQPNPKAAMSFYGDLFGWEFEGTGEMPGVPGGEYYVARVRGRDIAGIGTQPPENASPVAPWNTYVCVDSADEATGRVRDAGGTVLVEPLDAPPAGRLAVVTDPANAVFGVWEAEARNGAQLVNEPSAWSMSSLNTRETEDAKRFYGTVFGWEPEAMQVADAEFTLFRLPGYLGGEPQQPVPRDVVATMAPMGDQFPDSVPAHWSVDFWVDDLDGTVAKADQLGGEVVVSPYGIPNTALTQARLADPQGAVFSVTKVTVPG